MPLLKEIQALIKKDLVVEWRQKYALAGILLYVVSTVFLINIALKSGNAAASITGKYWNILFWITILFAAINSVTKSFFQENRERLLYYYTLVSPQAIILAKIIYNLILLLMLAILCYAVFTLLLGSFVVAPTWFLLSLLLGVSAFSILFSMMSAIAMKANNNATLMAILSFPLILPSIMLLIHLSGSAVGEIINIENNWNDVAVLSALNLAMIALAYILFPYLWRD